jgi:DNA-binding MarR family transcriptional regulator
MAKTILIEISDEEWGRLQHLACARHRSPDAIIGNLVCTEYEAIYHPRLAKDRRRIMSYVDRSGGPDACWPWTGCIDRRAGAGYGVTCILGKGTRAHRAIWFLETGELLGSDNILRHKCDNRSCVNPSHLEVGTHADNIRDALERTCDQKGENNYASRFTQAQVDEMRHRASTGEMQKDIARDFGASQGTVSNIVRGLTWKESFDPTKHRSYGQRRKLTHSQVDEIRRAAANGTTQKILARRFGVSPSNISAIVRGRTWRSSL